jgi:hypothetical protein
MQPDEDSYDYREKPLRAMPGYCVIVANTIILLISTVAFIAAPIFEIWYLYSIAGIGFTVGMILFKGLFIIEPNVAFVCTFCGKYLGTVRGAGYWYVNPMYSKQKVSLRLSNYETRRIKVNDAIGNPVEL